MGLKTVQRTFSDGTVGQKVVAENSGGARSDTMCWVDVDGIPIHVSGRVTPADAVNLKLVNGSSSPDMNIDGSTPVDFVYTVPAERVFEVHRLLIYLDDAVAFSAAGFAGITALTNGVDVYAGGVLLDTWQSNRDIALTMHDFIGFKNMAKEDKSGSGRWMFDRSFGGPLILATGEEFKIVIQDDLTGLESFHAEIQGRLFDS